MLRYETADCRKFHNEAVFLIRSCLSMSVKNNIEEKLREEFAPSCLDVIDESCLHSGHSGSRAEGESHFRIKISADSLSDLPRVKRHQAIYKALSHEMDKSNPMAIHALAIEIV